MIPAPPHVREAERLRELLAYDVLDSLPEVDYDEIVRLAAFLCGAPVALMSLVDEKRQWFKARHGLEGVTETPRELSFCGHAIHQNGILVVPDAKEDERFHDNPFVTEPMGIRFYAGASLMTESGLPLGTLCVVDTKPRQLTAEQHDALSVLSRQIMHGLELRRKNKELASLVARLQESARIITQQQAAIVEAERLASIGEMAVRVSHEINNPVTIICGKISMAMECLGTEDGEGRARALLESAHANALRIAQVVKALRQFTQPAPDTRRVP